VFKQSEFAAATDSAVEGDALRKSSLGETVSDAAARLIGEARQNQRIIQNRSGISPSNVSNDLGFVYEGAIQGFSAKLTQEGVDYIAQDPLVDYVEPDRIISINAFQDPTPAWGLDRIDQRALPLDNSYEYEFDGTNVHAYVIDTGINASHDEFTRRVGNGFDVIDNDDNPNDCNGHGTHVAGILGGSTYGVAKNVILHGVRVFGCVGDGTLGGVLAGLNWVYGNHVRPAVVNMSLGGGSIKTLDDAVNNIVAAGITVVVSAGNDNKDACTGSPARAANAITVASMDKSDRRSGFSDYGTCVDIFAPGSAIVSAGIDSNTATLTDNGTSMASPHVAGIATLVLEANPEFTPFQVTTAIINGSTRDAITNPGIGTPNRLAYSLLFDALDPPLPPEEPEAQNLVWLIPVLGLLLR
jgi:subtilisin family serine protease